MMKYQYVTPQIIITLCVHIHNYHLFFQFVTFNDESDNKFINVEYRTAFNSTLDGDKY